jgi:hypothetical protein
MIEKIKTQLKNNEPVDAKDIQVLIDRIEYLEEDVDFWKQRAKGWQSLYNELKNNQK